MRKIFLVLLVLGMTLAITSCTSFRMSGLEFSAMPELGEIVGNFDTTVRINRFLAAPGSVSVFNVSAGATDPAIVNAIRHQIANMGGTMAVNVSIVETASFGDFFLNTITWGLWAPSTIRVTGTVVR